MVEHPPLGTILLILSAIDDDVGDHADISYSITAGNDQGLFNLTVHEDANFAVLTVVGDLDLEASVTEFRLTIVASNSEPLADESSSPATDTVSIRIVAGELWPS